MLKHSIRDTGILIRSSQKIIISIRTMQKTVFDAERF